MYWSQWDTAILWTGILTAALGALPVKTFDARSRLISGGIGGGLIILAIITGNLQSFTYPQIVEIAPIFPIIAAGVIIFQNWQKSQEKEKVGSNPLPVPVVSGALEREASNPETPLERLADLAHEHPELWELIASNPSTYPDLSDWLHEHGTESVRLAIRSRA